MTNEEQTQPPDRTALAVAAATVAACATAMLAGFAYTLTFLQSPRDFLDPSFYGVSFYVGATAAIVAALACPLLFLLIGVPLHALARWRGWTGVWAYVSVGCAMSCLAAIAALFVFPSDRNFAVPLTVVGGSIATLRFWMVARPDKR